jgi:hypothetical protein
MLKCFYYEAGGKITMKLRAKGYLETQKKVAGDKLTARRSSLKEKGLDDAAIQRDSVIRKMKAGVRKTDYRLACIAAQEKLNADKIQIKAEKLAAKKNAPDKPRTKGAKGAAGKMEKKEKKKEKKKEQPPVPEEKAQE